MAEDDDLPTWQTVTELTSAEVSRDCTLVGGLMVAAHARRAGVMMRRPTDDVDLVANYLANRAILGQLRAVLHGLGFGLGVGDKYSYRFSHADGRKLDLLVADHLPSRLEPRMGRRPAFPMPAGEQAIRRRDTYLLRFKSGVSARIGVPDELGALVAKGAAWLVDRRDRSRHLDDSAVLLACVSDVSQFAFESLSKNDGRRLRGVGEALLDAAHPAWLNLDSVDREHGQFTLRLLRQRLGLDH